MCWFLLFALIALSSYRLSLLWCKRALRCIYTGGQKRNLKSILLCNNNNCTTSIVTLLYWTFFYLQCNYSWSVIMFFSETMVFSVSLAFLTFLCPILYVHGEACKLGFNKNNNNWNFWNKENFSRALIWFVL